MIHSAPFHKTVVFRIDAEFVSVSWKKGLALIVLNAHECQWIHDG